jgi:ABC-type branched-subunit amino acid transport system substrate-binding protein
MVRCPAMWCNARLFLISSSILLCLCVRAWSEESKALTRFGVTLTLTGDGAQFGEACKNALLMARDDINNAGGVGGKPLELVIEDFGNLDLKRAASAAHKLIAVDHVSVMMTNWSEDTEVIGPIANNARVLTMTLGAGGPGATRYSPNIFRATTSDSELALASVRELRAAGAVRACLLHSNTNYFHDISQEIRLEWEARGGVVAYAAELDFGTRDIASLITRVRRSDCDSVFVWAGPGLLAKVVRELKSQRVKGSRVIPWFGDVPEVLSSLKGDTEVTYLYRWTVQDRSFLDRYSQRFGMPAQRPAGNCYDGLTRLARAADKVGVDLTNLSRELLASPAAAGVTGQFIIHPNRERSGEVFERVIVTPRG